MEWINQEVKSCKDCNLKSDVVKIICTRHFDKYLNDHMNLKVNDIYQWISVNERLPDLYTHVLVYCESDDFDGGPYFVAKYFDEANCWDICNDTCSNSSNYNGFVPSHWMPLPEPPNEMD